MENQTSLFPKEQKDIKGKANPIDETLIWNAIKNSICSLPHEQEELLPGVKWGNYARLYTPAFWKMQHMASNFPGNGIAHRLSSNILEEIVMCLLGGFGIPSEMGIIAFQRMKLNGLIKKGTPYADIFAALSSPFVLDDGKAVRYRFYNQKSRYLHTLLNRPDLDLIPLDTDIDLRNWLLTIEGIGLKTASWITRNWLNSNQVAILDVHVIRAGILAGIFEKNADVTNEYLKLEKLYLQFCTALGVPAADLDAIIWHFMKNSSKLAIKSINYS